MLDKVILISVLYVAVVYILLPAFKKGWQWIIQVTFVKGVSKLVHQLNHQYRVIV